MDHPARGELVGVLLVDAGIAVGIYGLIALLRPFPALRIANRKRAAAVSGAGLLLAVTGALLPARERTATAPATPLDDFVPRWQFAERHEIRIHAPLARVESAVRDVTAGEIRLFRLLTWLRNPRLPGGDTPETILSPSAHRPILEAALSSGFMLLAEEADELVIGTLVIVPREHASAPPDKRERHRAALTPALFAALADSGYAKAAMSFRWTDEGGGWCRVVTETRVFATSPGARRRFVAYWRLIYPGSATIRRMWLRAIRDRAEAAPS